jgi:predicted amidophosphoribosyltransferase
MLALLGVLVVFVFVIATPIGIWLGMRSLRQGKIGRCPACRGAVSVGVRHCPNCGTGLNWLHRG